MVDSKRKIIPLARPFFDSEEIKQVQETLDSGWVSQGPKVKEFEARVCEYLSVNYAVSVCNCTAALHLSLLAIGLKEGDEALVADFTFPATGHSVMYCGAKPVFIDINPKTYNIEPEFIQDKITSRTKAIIPVHTFGQPADMDSIATIAKEYKLKVIEDAACAFGSKYKGKFAGTIGDIGCFSFHARKGLTTGEGGMVVTNDKNYADKIRMLSTFGMSSAWDRKGKLVIPEFTDLGFNYKMSDITAAVGVAQLNKLDKMIEKRIYLADYWDNKLDSIKMINKPFRDENSFHIYQSYVTIVHEEVDRDQLIQKLLDNGIQTQIGTYASHIQPIYHSEQKCRISLDVFHRSLALPFYVSMTEQDIDYVSGILEKELQNCVRDDNGK